MLRSGRSRATPKEPELNFPLIRRTVLVLSIALVSRASLAAPRATAPALPSRKAAATMRPLTLVYGDNHVFGVTIPEGWTLDDTSGLGSRIRVVLYPKGEKWKTANTVMYVNPIHQSSGTAKTLRQMVDADVAAFRKNSPKGAVTTVPALRTSKDKAAEVRYFAPGGGDPLEAVAYVEEEGLVMLLVMSSHTTAGFQKALPAFQDLVHGYQFVAAGVKTPY